MMDSMTTNRDLTARESELQASVSPGSVVVASTGRGPFEQLLLDGRHAALADEPRKAGGSDAGPGPYELLLMALGACKSMTMRMYAARKQWPLEQAVVRLEHAKVHVEDCEDCERGALLNLITCRIELTGDLDDAQRARLIEIADKCPVHRTLTSKIEIRTSLAD